MNLYDGDLLNIADEDFSNDSCICFSLFRLFVLSLIDDFGKPRDLLNKEWTRWNKNRKRSRDRFLNKSCG